MTLSGKIKALLELTNTPQKELAEKNGISKQQQSNKINNGAYRLADLIKLAEHTKTKLAFIDEDNKPVVTFDVKDLEK